MEVWIPITLLAAVAQTTRTAIQRYMKGPLGDYGASAIRFIYAVPFTWIWLLVVFSLSDESFPKPGTEFLIWGTLGGIAQILFTVFLVRLFSYKNFLVGVAFSKTEVLLAAIIEAIFFSATIGIQFGIAILFGIIAVLLLSLRRNAFTWREIGLSLQSTSTIIGLLCAVALAMSVISFRAAINSLPESGFLLRASMTAAIVIVGQTLAMGIYLFAFRRKELIAALTLWKPGMATGLFGAIATACWFAAFALQRAAPVRAVGQAELLFAIAFTTLVFHQKLTRIELLGVSLLFSSILLVIFQ
ncbi:hypothetical protein FIM02_00480 [SAR202 cluster bacterium AD-802-E10_MRT_200m]|nr:hypothetical protein [SAR202 cluster bacterium AD-802-E10_MRT_200m]